MEKIKVGIIGCGMITKERHIPAYKRMKDKVNLKAVCDLDLDLAKETAKENNIPKTYVDSSEMYLKEDLDIIDICVPPQVHSQVALEALENNCHVIMEKPMALKVSDCDEMIKVAKKQNLKICTIHNVRYHPAFIKAKRKVDDGEIGEFLGMRILLSTPKHHMMDMKDHWYHSLPGGVLGETGPHIAYMSLAFLDEIMDAEVFAKNFLGYDWAPYDEFRIELEGKNAMSSVTLSYTTDYWAAKMELLGTKRVFFLDLEKMLLNEHFLEDLDYKSIGKSAISDWSQLTKDIISNSIGVLTGSKKAGTDKVIEEFVKSIHDGTRPPITGEEGKKAVEVVEKIVDNYKEKYGEGVE